MNAHDLPPQSLLIWWTSREDCQAIDTADPPLSATLPPELVTVYRERAATNTPLLWSPATIGLRHVPLPPGHPVANQIRDEDRAGIVFLAADLGKIEGLPGFITTLGLEVVSCASD